MQIQLAKPPNIPKTLSRNYSSIKLEIYFITTCPDEKLPFNCKIRSCQFYCRRCKININNNIISGQCRLKSKINRQRKIENYSFQFSFQPLRTILEFQTNRKYIQLITLKTELKKLLFTTLKTSKYNKAR